MTTLLSDFFEQDHQRLDQLFNKFQQETNDANLAVSLFSEFKHGLEQHIEWEEQILFPAVEQAAGFPINAGPTHVMRMEHQQIKECLMLIQTKVQKHEDSKLAEMRLLDILAEHNFKEERVLYPMSDQSISESNAQTIIEQCKAQK
jgi:iron-sulfur cluster repair protein YtfE (RIC family)